MRVSGRSQALTSNALGAGGRRFESGRPDYRNCLLIGIFCYFVLRFGLGCAGNLDPYTTPVHQTLSPFGLRLDTSGMRGVCTGPSPASRSSLAGGRAVAGSNPVAPIPYRSAKASEHGATTPENAEPRGTLFARVRGCSWGLGPQTDRRMAVAVRFAVPLEARADPSVIAGHDARTRVEQRRGAESGLTMHLDASPARRWSECLERVMTGTVLDRPSPSQRRETPARPQGTPR